MNHDGSMVKNNHYPKVAIAACFGTFLEWYDFLTFATLATFFSSNFFSSSDPNTSLLASLATFGIGMIVRPIGAALFGSMGDRIGRRPVFMITICLMGFATFSVGFLPTYAQIGIWAPILLVFLRILQGLSAGGEIGGSAVYLTEHAGSSQRGFKTSFLQIMGPLGILFSTLQVALLREYLSAEDFQSWGWRIPFWLSIVLLAIAFKARIALEETPVFIKLNKSKISRSISLFENLKDKEIRKKMLLVFFCVSSPGAILFFCVQIYTFIFLKSILDFPPQITDQLNIFSICILIPLIVFAGWLSDKIGRRPVVIAGLFLGAASIYPIFEILQYLSQSYISNTELTENIYLIGLMLTFLSLPLALVVGPQTALLAELFPAETRNSAATFPHNLAAGWIGGLLPLIVSWINIQTESNLAGLWYPICFLGIASVVAIYYLPESFKKILYDP